MKIVKIFRMVLACVCVFALIFSYACGGADSDTTHANTTETPAGTTDDTQSSEDPAPDATQEDITLRMAWWGGDARHEATLAALEIFEAKNPGIVISPEYQGYDGYHEKIITQLSGGTAPDLFQFSPGEIPIVANYVVDLFDFAGNELDLLNVPDNNYAEGVIDGKLLTIPLSMQTFVLFINKTMLEQAGVDIPGNDWTWDDYYALLEELGDKLPAGVYPSNDLRMGEVPILYVHQQGGALLTPDGEIKFAAYAGPFLERFQELMENGLVPPMDETTTGTDELFTEGRAAITFTFNAMAAGLEAEMAGGDEIMMLPIPGSQDSRRLGMWVKGEIGMSVNGSSNYASETAQLLSAIINDEDMNKELKMVRGVPPSSKILEMLSQDMTPLEKNVLEMQMLAIESLDIPEPRHIPGWGSRLDVIEPEVQLYAFGSQTLQETLDNIEANFARELRAAE